MNRHLEAIADGLADVKRFPERVAEAVEVAAQAAQERQDRIDSRRALADVRRYVREHRAEIDAEWDALPDVPRTLAQHQAYAAKLTKGDAL